MASKIEEKTAELQNLISKDLVSVSDLIMTIVQTGHSVTFFQQEGDESTNYVIHLRIDDKEQTVCTFGEDGIKKALLSAIRNIMEEMSRERRTRFDALELNY